MCGIAGAYDLKGRRHFPESLIRKMTDALIHRGPDSEGYFSAPGYAAGVRRLILRDPAGGGQPMQDAETVISLNGELFSFQRDRDRLLSKGIILYTKSDTEVFLKGIENEGTEFLKNADAQFALAVYSRKNHSVFLARDRFGITPLFYAVKDGWLLFASEVKSILASGLLDAVLNPDAVDHILCRLALDPGESCFENIHSLPPGCSIQTEGENISLRRYFSADYSLFERNNDIKLEYNDKKCADILDTLLNDSVRRRLEADAEIGLYLSGGVDSSVIAAVAASCVPPEKKADLTAYSVRLETPLTSKDESEYAEETVMDLGIRHRILRVTDASIMMKYPKAVYSAETPVLDHANVCLLQLADLVRSDGKKAVLTGEGADEAFGGYPWQAVSRVPSFLRRHFLNRAGDIFSSNLTRSKNAEFREFSQFPLFSVLSSVRNLFYSRAFKERIYDTKSSFIITKEDSRKKMSVLQRSLLLDYEWLLSGHLLADKGDRVSMAASVEARYPFLDSELVKFASQLPDRMKIRNGRNKLILRQTAEKYLRPDTAWRKKHLFRAEPVTHGAGRPDWAEQLLSAESVRKVGLFDPELVRQNLQKRDNPSFFSVKDSFIQAGLSGVLSTQLLYHIFCGGGLCDLRTDSFS